MNSRRALLLVCFTVLVGCASKRGPTVNVPGVTPYEDQDLRYSTLMIMNDRIKPLHPKQRDPVFIGVAISGGGTRATNFGLAALSELEEMGLLEHATVVSGISGGSLAAAYFATKGAPKSNAWLDKSDAEFLAERRVFWSATKELFLTNLRTKLVTRSLLPHEFFSLMFLQRTRTDVLSDVLDDTVFGDARFADLGPPGPLRPYLRLGATVSQRIPRTLEEQGGVLSNQLVGLPASGQQFSFIARSFRRLNSDLAKLRMSDAVAASSAFPGVFADVSLAAFDAPKDGAATIGYVKLLDGGPSDNLGVEAVGDTYAHWLGQTLGQTDRPSCLLVVVDAFARETETPDGFRRRDNRRWYDRVVDTNFISALDALLVQRRVGTLGALGAAIEATTEVEDPVVGERRWVWGTAETFNTQGGSKTPFNSSCALWHLSFENAAAMGARKDPIKQTLGVPSPSEDVRWNIAASYWLSASTSTDFNLVGPPMCSREVLQDAIWDAAKVLVHDDHDSRQRVCTWMRKQGISIRDTCDAAPTKPFRRARYEVAGVSKDGVQSVSCVK